MPVSPLAPDALYNRCTPERFSFENTGELQALNGLFGQNRALEAIRFGTRITHPGYNLFVLGPGDAAADEAVEGLLRQLAAEEEPPFDWVYVNNFTDPDRPQALRLKRGDGRRLRDRVAGFVTDLRNTLPAIFQSEEYLGRRKAIEDAFEKKHTDALGALQYQAEAEGIALVSTQSGIGFAAMQDGEVMSPEDYAALPEEERDRIERLIEEIQGSIEDIFQQIPRWEAERVDELDRLNKEFADFAVGHSINDLRKAFEDDETVLAWLTGLHDDVVSQVHIFAPQAAEGLHEVTPQGDMSSATWRDPFHRYEVNLFVDNEKTTGAPVVMLDHPTLGNLVGRIEHRSQMGALVTDPTLIRAGALHKANGGYLLIDALKVLRDPMAWEALKRSLRRLEVVIESYGEQYSMISTLTLEPEPIPIDLKVVLFGPPALYHMLNGREPDFPKLFKVQVEFSDSIERDEEAHQQVARMLGTAARDEGLRPLDPAGIARVIEHSSRLAGDGERLSILMEPLRDLLREADFSAAEAGAAVITAAHVQEALDSQETRADRLRERFLEYINDDMQLIETDGERTGQINALVVRSLPNYSFGSPSRVTARVRAGGNGVINIERSVGFGRAIYSKGVEILSAWLLATFATDRAIQFAATIAHEQNYRAIDGDSASSTELYVLLSALADLPIRQGLAVTGSVNQFGEVQVIGGVNEKIEGFFDLCSLRGLTGDQGVLIPAGNIRQLMLREDIVAAARAGKFQIYGIETIEQGIELLTGVPAGSPDENGNHPSGTVYGMVERRLKELAGNRGNGGEAGGGGAKTPPRKRWWPF